MATIVLGQGECQLNELHGVATCKMRKSRENKRYALYDIAFAQRWVILHYERGTISGDRCCYTMTDKDDRQRMDEFVMAYWSTTSI